MLVPLGQHQGQRPLPLGRLFTLIGSSASARLYLPSKAVSRCHAVVINTGGELFVRDLASRTHTRVNGRVVAESDLREGDVLQVGGFTFRFTDPTAPKVKPPAPPAPAAALEVDGLDQPLPVQGRTVLIGRRDTADISLTENAASSAHVLLFVAEGKHLVRDLNSRTGTFVNGVKVNEHALFPGDVLRVGETEFRYVRTFASPAPAGDVSAEPSADPSAATPEPAPEEVTSTAPTEDGEESNAAKDELAEAGDFDFVPAEVAADTTSAAASEAPHGSAADAGDVDRAPPAGDDPGASAVGLLEMGESSREDVLKDDPSDAIISPGEMLEQPREAAPPQPPEQPADSGREETQPTTPPADREPIELALADESAARQGGDDDQLKLELSDEAPATPPAPALAPPSATPDPAVAPVQQRRRWSAKKTVQPAVSPPRQAPPTLRPPPPASKERPDSRPEKTAPARGKIPSFGQRPARPRSPFDVLGGADDLELLPELPPEDPPPAPPRTGNPGNTPAKD